MAKAISVGIIGATSNVGRTVVNGLLTSDIELAVTSFTRHTSVHSDVNQQLKLRGVNIVSYDLTEPLMTLQSKLNGINVLISCITWEHLRLQIPWIEAAKEAGVKRFVPSEWVGPAPRGVIDIKDTKLEILGAIQRAGLPYTIIDIGCFYQVFVPKLPSGRSDHASSIYIDHRIVGNGTQKFALTDLDDIGKYVAKIVSDSRTLNNNVFAYIEVMSMNEIWDTMASVSGESPFKSFITEAGIHLTIKECGQKLRASSETAHHPDNIMNTANFNMGQYRLSWCIRGGNTPGYAEYLGYQLFQDLFPEVSIGRSLETFYRHVINASESVQRTPS